VKLKSLRFYGFAIEVLRVVLVLRESGKGRGYVQDLLSRQGEKGKKEKVRSEG